MGWERCFQWSNIDSMIDGMMAAKVDFVSCYYPSELTYLHSILRKKRGVESTGIWLLAEKLHVL